MEIKGKVVQLLELQSGEGKNGTWKKQEYIIETLDSKYPKKVCVSVWGDKIDQFAMQQGENVIASIEVESREFNGKWYTNIQAWRVQKDGDGGVNQEAPEMNQVPDFIANSDEETDDLPF